MLAWLLNLAYLALLVFVSPLLMFRSLKQGKYRQGWAQKLWGAVPQRAGQRPCLWLHAVSVGEVLQLGPILEGLSRDRPDLEFVISVTTTTGYDLARGRFPQCLVVYYPLDFSWAVARAIDRLRPTAIALVELELWPNFLFAAAERRIPVLLINGRISERSFRGYRRIRPLVQAMLQRIRRLLVQNETYSDRFVRLGADRARVTVTGSIKFDGAHTDRRNHETLRLSRLFGLQPDERVFIAGSTQAPEERYAIDAWLAARRECPNLRLILVPRHKERFDEVARLVEDEYGLPLLRRSRLDQTAIAVSKQDPAVVVDRTVRADTRRASSAAKQDDFDRSPDDSAAATSQIENPKSKIQNPILLLDTLGELSACWGLADIAFVGGSFTDRGGQNMIEPAAFGAVVLFGPNTWNFKDVVDLLLTHEAAVVVRSPAELTARLQTFLAEPRLTEEYGMRAQTLVARQRGATERTLDLISSTLQESQQAAADRSSRAAKIDRFESPSEPTGRSRWAWTSTNRKS